MCDSSQLRILHISDLHCGKETRSGAAWRFQRVLGEKWLENLREIRSDGKPDIVCFTGDLAQSGQVAEYEEVGHFLDQTLAALGVGKECLFVVPGNHDIDRTIHPEGWRQMRAAPPDGLSRWMAGGATPFGCQDVWREQVLARQQNFRNWERRYFAGCSRQIIQNHGQLGYRVTLAGLAVPIHLIGLDSAWLAGDDSDMGKLRLTDEQVGRHLAGLEGIKIAMLHHPLGELADGTACRGLLAEYGVNLVLHGHVHDPNHQRWQHPNHDAANLMQESVAGCLYEHDQYPNCMQVLDVAVDGAAAGRVRQVWLRSWSKKGFWHSDDSHYKDSRDGRLGLTGDVGVCEPPVRTSATAVAPEQPLRKWVWHCTDESIAAGQVSVLAIAEIFAALGIYWWTAHHFEWPWMMFVGMVAAPMLLLRSGASIELGVALLTTYWRRENNNIGKMEKILIFLIVTATTAFFNTWLFSLLPTGTLSATTVLQYVTLGSFGFLTSIFIGTSVAFSFAGTIAVVNAVNSTGSVARLGAFSTTFSFIPVIAFTSPQSNILTSTSIFSGIIISANIFSVLAKLTGPKFLRGDNGQVSPLKNIFKILTFAFIGPFVILGIFSRGFFIRLFATLRYPLAGLAQLPQNWQETLMIVDLTHPPELLPGANTISEHLGVKGLWLHRKSRTDEGTLVLALFLLAWCIPALAYRWSLKASAWLWWPLSLALTQPLHRQTPQASRRLIATIPAWHLQIGALAAAIVVWLLSSSPLLVIWLPLLPKELFAIAHILPLPPPQWGLRAILAYIGFALTALLIFRSKNLKASHGKVLESPNEFNALTPADHGEFLSIAKSIDRIRLLLIAVIVLWGEAMALGFMHARYASTVERFISTALLQYL